MSWYIGVIDLNVYIGFRVVMVLFIGVNWELLFIFYVYLNGLDISLEFLFEIVFIYVIKIFNLIYLNYLYDGTYIRYINIFVYKLVL